MSKHLSSMIDANFEPDTLQGRVLEKASVTALTGSLITVLEICTGWLLSCSQ